MVNLIIVGARKFVPYLIQSIASHGLIVAVIEKDLDRCAVLSSNQHIKVINGYGSDTAILELAGIKHCDRLLALTNSDLTNLTICKLANKKYHVRRTMAWVNNPYDRRAVCCFRGMLL